MIRPEMPTSLPKYYSGLGWAVQFGGDFTDTDPVMNAALPG
jgi:hypothetical protein